jgi:hypothetical protein
LLVTEVRYVFYLLAEQDKGLESLSHVITRQKQMAIDIGDEVDSQNGKTITQVFFLSEVCLFVNIQLNLVMLMSNGL